MMLKCKNKFWLENIPELFCDFALIPMEGMSLSAQMNAITRLVVMVFFVLLLLGFKYSFLFLLLSLLFIIILYYIQRNMERYHKSEKYTAPMTTMQQIFNADTDALRWCNDAVPLNPNDPNYMSINQRLVGKPNPKTHIPPVVPIPASDLSYWRANNLVTHSNINSQTQYDNFQSGYQVSDCCKTMKCNHRISNESYCGPRDCFADRRSEYTPPTPPPGPKPDPSPRPGPRPSPSGYPGPKPDPSPRPGPRPSPSGYPGPKPDPSPRPGSHPSSSGYSGPHPSSSGYSGPHPSSSGYSGPHPSSSGYPGRPTHNPVQRHNAQGQVIEPFEFEEVREPGIGHVNMACGYDVENLDVGLPVNLSSGACDRTNTMKPYNEEIFTQTIQPGVYSRNQVNEPINYNIGISFEQQFNPTFESRDAQGNIIYTQMDPGVIEPISMENVSVIDAVDEANVYDPRYTGYGTSYRSYTNDDLGRTDFYYKDVDAIRMPNYISRSNIDFAKYADKYGPLPQGYADGNPNTNNIREMAQDSWVQSSLEFRNDLMFRQMRKTNAEHWQSRRAPVRGQVFMAGGMAGSIMGGFRSSSKH